MPIYEYACKKCGEFEVTQRITEDPLKKCPSCGRKVTKLISQSAFHLKGSGWYETDFKGKKPSKDTNGEPAATKKKEAKPGKDQVAPGKSEAEPSGGKASQAGAAND